MYVETGPGCWLEIKPHQPLCPCVWTWLQLLPWGKGTCHLPFCIKGFFLLGLAAWAKELAVA